MPLHAGGWHIEFLRRLHARNEEPESPTARSSRRAEGLTPSDRIPELEAAIRKHRDQRGDDRCWLDDMELYAVLGDARVDLTLPPKDEFLGHCARFWECRQRHEDPEDAVDEYKNSEPMSPELAALNAQVITSIIMAPKVVVEESSD